MGDQSSPEPPRAPVAQATRKSSPLPLIIVVSVPIATVLLRLPIWVTLIVLILETVLLVLSPHLREKRVHDPKKAWVQLMATFARLRTAHAELRRAPASEAARVRFVKLEEECRALFASRADSDWGSDAGYVAKIKKEYADILASVPAPDAAPQIAESPEAARLFEIKKRGILSEGEFAWLSDKIRTLASEKACGLLETVSGYQVQCREGKLKEEDFHAALRGLLEKLESGTAGPAPEPATLPESATTVVKGAFDVGHR
jgi:hypothetical protein